MAQYISGPKKYNILTLALVVVLSFFFVVLVVQASSTIGTNMSTTGTLAVTSGASLSAGLEIGTYASMSGNFQFGGSGTHTLGVNSGSGALTINAFTLGGAVTGNSQNITGLGNVTATAASLSAGLEIGTYASMSGNFQFGGSGTHTLGVNSGSGALTINAFTLGGAVTGNSQNITGVAAFGSTAASISTIFEASDYASASKLIIGGQLASISTGARYTAEFSSGNPTASTSINFGGAFKGTCLQMRDQDGKNVYVRISGGAVASGSFSQTAHFLISTTSCR